MTSFGRRKFLKVSLLSSTVTISGGLLLQSCAPDFAAMDAAVQSDGEPPDPESAESAGADEADDGTIKVGILHSLSGSMAISETPIVDAELLAIEEINASGGLLGKQLVPIKEDAASDWPTFAEKAEKLIDLRGVSVIFGGLASESRKAILPVVKAKNKLLWYPGAYEGQECSDHIFYAGATANQQVAPAVSWMVGNRGKSFFLVSSNARTLHEIAKEQVRAYGGKVAGEAYVPMVNGVNVDMNTVIDDIKKALPNGGIIFNALVGSHNRAFFRALKGAGLSTADYLVMSVRVAEEEVFQIGSILLDGHYAAWDYFQTIDSPENQEWVSKFQDKYGPDRVVGAPMATAYAMVHLWAQAVTTAGSTDTEAVREAAYGQTFQAPGGPTTVQPNHHITKTARIGRVGRDGLFEIMHTGDTPIDPVPWSQSLAASKGFACDWSDPAKGEKYAIESTDSSVKPTQAN